MIYTCLGLYSYVLTYLLCHSGNASAHITGWFEGQEEEDGVVGSLLWGLGPRRTPALFSLNSACALGWSKARGTSSH